MSFVSAIQIETADQDEDFEWALSEERRRLCIELVTFRPQLLTGFVSPAAKARCAAVCLRLQQIDLLLSGDEDEEE